MLRIFRNDLRKISEEEKQWNKNTGCIDSEVNQPPLASFVKRKKYSLKRRANNYELKRAKIRRNKSSSYENI